MFQKIIKTLVDYLETKLEIYKLQLKEEVARALTAIVLMILYSMIGLLFILFLSLFISQALNGVLESQYLGYLIVAGFYLILGITVYKLRKKIYEGVEDSVLSEDNGNDN